MSEVKLFQRYLCDLKKMDLDKFERAKLIKDYMDKNNLSGRAFAKEFEIPKSTVEDWLLWNKITPARRDELKSKGYSESDVYRLIRDNKTKDITDMTEFDHTLDKAIRVLNSSKSAEKISPYTKEKIDLLIKAINTFKFRLEKRN